MRQILRFVAVLLGLGLAGCAANPIIHTDMDRTADFAAYRTFGFAERPGTDHTEYASLLTQRLERAVTRELAGRDYVQDESYPDLLVDFHSASQDKLRVTASPPLLPPFPSRYDGYGTGFYDPWPGYGGFTDVQSYTEGILHIDLIDRQHGKVVWQGVATSRSLPDAAPVSEQEIDQTVQQIFAGFPAHAAGS